MSQWRAGNQNGAAMLGGWQSAKMACVSSEKPGTRSVRWVSSSALTSSGRGPPSHLTSRTACGNVTEAEWFETDDLLKSLRSSYEDFFIYTSLFSEAQTPLAVLFPRPTNLERMQ